MQVSIKLTGLDALESKLKEIKAKGEDTAPLMAELANHLYNVVDTSFEKEQTPDGKKWSPIQFRKNDRNPNRILFDEGDTQDSLSQTSSSDEAAIGLNATSDGYPYPIVHQFGSEDGTTEARAFIPIDENGEIYSDTLDELNEVVEDYIKEILK